MTILIADDDRVLAGVLSARLKKEGHRVVVAFDAMGAIVTALRNPPAIVLLDVNMPGGTGLQVLRQLRNSIKTSQVPIIVISGSLEPETEKTVRELGADDFLSKPPDYDQLIAKINQLVKQPGDGAKPVA